MASAGDIATVRRNVNESTTVIYSDGTIGTYIDANGVTGASAIIWREKAARYSELVNVSESGASHSYSDLYKAALAMASKYESIEFLPPVSIGHVHVKKIVRS